MKIYYYVHTGHRIGLDRFRRMVAILNALQDVEITVLTSDFRIAHIAREFGIENCVGVDVVRNIPYIAHHGDKLIFDSNEANPVMLNDMRGFFSKLIRISDLLDEQKAQNESLISPFLSGDGIFNDLIVEDKYFKNYEKTTEVTYFFGDDDYEKDLERHLDFIDFLNPKLQLGYYYFLDYEDMLKEKFKEYFEFEEYFEMITTSKILITASPQAVLDSLASGGKPIYFQRDDYAKDFLTLFERLNVPIIKNYNKNKFNLILENIDTHNYVKITQNTKKIAKFIKENLDL